jgi:hypothetical protein
MDVSVHIRQRDTTLRQARWPRDSGRAVAPVFRTPHGGGAARFDHLPQGRWRAQGNGARAKYLDVEIL